MWNFSGRFTKSNFILFSIHNNIYHQTDETSIYTRATMQQKLKSNENTWLILMDDLNVYSTSHQQLKKIIQQTTDVMKKTRLNLRPRQVLRLYNKRRSVEQTV